MANDMRPCPFCGRAPVGKRYQDLYWYECSGFMCGLSAADHRSPIAAEAEWNSLYNRVMRLRAKDRKMAGNFRILVCCETSGVVRRAFADRGFDAWSCDLLPSDDMAGKHMIGDARDIAYGQEWDMIICHPPCTRLCNSGVRWLHNPPPGKTREEMWADLDEAASLFGALWNAPVKHIAVENPVMHRYGKERIRGYMPPAQSIQPWEFGHGETKRTCLWLRNLPLLYPTNIVDGRIPRIHRMPPGPDRWKERSRTYQGIAEAMADQWGTHIIDTWRQDNG